MSRAGAEAQSPAQEDPREVPQDEDQVAGAWSWEGGGGPGEGAGQERADTGQRCGAAEGERREGLPVLQRPRQAAEGGDLF